MQLERNAAFLAQRYHKESFHYRSLERPGEKEGLASWITYFDTNWDKEGLPFTWHLLQNKNHKIGFSIKGQLRTLMDLTDGDQVARFRQRTKQDLLGFKLEYLSDHLIYPRRYTLKSDSGRMEDPLYGTIAGDPNTSPDVVEVVSADERKGTVKETLNKMKDFFLSPETPAGSLAIMTSPEGETGLKTDDGSSITYPDSYFFIMEKNTDGTVMNYTLKTDFSLEESRKAIFALTGQELPEDALLEDFVTALATIRPGEHPRIERVTDVIAILQEIHPQNPWKEKDWESVYEDIGKGEALYAFDTRTHEIIRDFEAFCVPGYVTTITYHKAIAATILRMSDAYYQQIDQEHVAGTPIPLMPNTWQEVRPKGGAAVRSFGDIVEEVAKKPGCAGGSSSETGTTGVTTAGGERLGTTLKDEYGSRTFDCPECGKENFRPQGERLSQCQNCSSTKVAC